MADFDAHFHNWTTIISTKVTWADMRSCSWSVHNRTKHLLLAVYNWSTIYQHIRQMTEPFSIVCASDTPAAASIFFYVYRYRCIHFFQKRSSVQMHALFLPHPDKKPSQQSYPVAAGRTKIRIRKKYLPELLNQIQRRLPEIQIPTLQMHLPKMTPRMKRAMFSMLEMS